MNAFLEIQGLGKSYQGPVGPVRALDQVSVSVLPGEFVTVQGQSGCGKTTLLLAAGGLLRPSAGRVIVNGQELYGMSPAQRAQFRAANMGFVFQQFHLIPYLNVFENILAPTLARSCGSAEARAHALLAHFGLQDRSAHVPSSLSTGERQRTALARALLNSPKLLLADEPTGNLDPENSTSVLQFLSEFARNGGAVLLVTHDSAAVRFAHRTVRLDSGRIVQT